MFEFDFSAFHKRIDAYLDETSKKINKLLEEKKVEAGKRMFNVVDLNEREKANASVVDLNEKEQKEIEEMAKKNETRFEGSGNDTKMEAKMSPPWDTYVTKMKVMFGQDPDIHMEYDEENVKLTMRVDKETKYEALEKLIPHVVPFGNVNLYINLIPANAMVGTENMAELFGTAFSGNPVFDCVYEAPNIFSNPMTFIMFKKEVVQYFCDNMADPNGKVSTLYQDLAKDILEPHEGVYYCTSVE